LNKIAAALNTKFAAGTKLAVNTNGNVVIVDISNNILYDLTAGVSTGGYQTLSTSTAPGPNGSTTTTTTYQEGFAGVEDGDDFAFADPQWSGTETSTNTFNVTAAALAVWIEIYIEQYGYTEQVNTEFGSHEVSNYSNTGVIELADDSATTVSSALSAGVYHIGFTITDSGGIINDSNLGEGIVTGTVSASGTQTGGQSFLDPFNGFGNFFEDYNF